MLLKWYLKTIEKKTIGEDDGGGGIQVQNLLTGRQKNASQEAILFKMRGKSVVETNQKLQFKFMHLFQYCKNVKHPVIFKF